MSTPFPRSAQKVLVQEGPEFWDDERLIEGLVEGNRDAASVLYRTLRPVIDRTLCRILHHRGPDYEDLVQITFERILRSLAEGRFARQSSLRTWTAAIAGHVALDYLRQVQKQRRRYVDGMDQDSIFVRQAPEAKMEWMSELQRIQNILARMKPDLVETLLLHDALGYRLNEISQLRNATESATQSRLLRARKELKRRAEATIARLPARGAR